MAKFHFNPETGRTGRCSAASGNCPYKISESLHSDTEVGAARNFEKVMEEAGAKTSETFKKRFTRDEITPKLSDSMDLDLMRKMIGERYIMANSHPDDPDLRILSYTRATQFSGNWNEATNSARGLMIRSSRSDLEDAVIIQRPWKKFFTLGQMQNPDGTPGWAFGDEESENSASDVLARIDFNAPAIVTDKMDGSLLILYRDPKGRASLSTKGSFSSEQSQYYTNLMRNNRTMLETSEKLLEDHADTTFLFEGVSMRHQIVLRYDQDDVAMLGAVKKQSGLYMPTSRYEKLWSPEKGLNRAEQMEAMTLDEALSMPDRENREGVVVLMNQGDPENQMMVKIKQEDYKLLHRTRTGFSAKVVRDSLSKEKDRTTMGDLFRIAETGDVSRWESVREIVEVPDGATDHEIEFAEKRRKSYESAVFPRLEKLTKAKKIVDDLPPSQIHSSGPEMVNFMKSSESFARENGVDRGDLIMLYKARASGESLDKRSGSGILSSIIKNARLGNLDEDNFF